MQYSLLAAPDIGEGRTERIGFIKLPQLYQASAFEGGNDPASSSRDVRKALEQFEKENADAVLLDLRANGGGVLTEVDEIAGLFVGDGPVVQLRAADRKVSVRSVTKKPIWKKPLILLTDQYVGSGGELLANPEVRAAYLEGGH